MVENVISLLERRRTGSRAASGRSGSFCSSSALDLKILLSLVRNEKTRSFQKVTQPITTQGDVRYENGKLFIRNGSSKTIDCYSVQDNIKAIRKLWSIPARPRCEDQAIVQDYKHKDYEKPSLLVLRMDSRLERYSLTSGELKQTFRLYKNVKFTEMSQDYERNWLILKSVKNNKSQGNDLLLQMIIMQNTPLEFLYHLEIRKSVFGSRTQDVSVSNGVFIVLGQKKSIQLYSVDEALLSSKISAGRYTELDGFCPNVEMRKLGPCLFSCSSFQHHLQINENPWLYINAQSEVSHTVEGLEKKVMLGELSSESLMTPDNVSFLGDSSGRVIVNGTGIKVFKPDLENKRLNLIFNLNLTQNTQDKMAEEFTRSGRRIAKNIYSDSVPTSTVTVGYEDELDILGLLVSEDISMETDLQVDSLTTFIKEVIIYDIRTLQKIRSFKMDDIVNRSGCDVTAGLSLLLDLDILIIKVRSSVKTVVFIYQLTELTENKPEIKAPCRSRGRQSQARRHTDPRTLQRRSTWNESYEEHFEL